MRVCDFAGSYVTFVTPGRENNARIQVEATCELGAEGRSTRYLLVASCKAEATYADDDLFRLPNYDFSCIFSDTEHRIIRVHLPLSDEWVETGVSDERFEQVHIHVAETAARLCEDEEAIVRATLDNLPLIGQTELLDDSGEVCARMEYPIKTMNVNDQRWAFQVDTGPMIRPDLSREVTQEIERFDLAFIAYNRFDRAELVIQEPTPAGEGGPPAGHYSRVEKVEARNRVLCVSEEA